MGGNLYFKRVGHIAISGPNGDFIDYGEGMNALDFKFHIKKSVYNPICEARIEVYGLNLPTIQRLTYWGYYKADELMKRRVQVYAGYADSGEGLLYDGYGYKVTPTQPPNAGVIIEAQNNLTYARKPKSVTVTKEADFRTIVEYVAEELGLVAKIDSDVPKKKIKQVHISGTERDMIRTLEGLADVYVWLEKGKNTDESNKEVKGVLRVANKIQKYPNGLSPLTLDLEHGLLGLNSLTLEGVEARVRLDSRLDRAGWVNIDSTLYPKRSSGNYWVHEIEHRGHFRGQEWETLVRAYNTNRLY